MKIAQITSLSPSFEPISGELLFEVPHLTCGGAGGRHDIENGQTWSGNRGKNEPQD